MRRGTWSILFWVCTAASTWAFAEGPPGNPPAQKQPSAPPPAAPAAPAPPPRAPANPQANPPANVPANAPTSPPVNPPANPPANAPANVPIEDESGSVSQPLVPADPNAAESLLKMRDPFKRPEAVGVDATPKSELEAYASHQYQLVGVMTGPREIRAIILTPNGKTFFVRKGDRIGQRRGIVEKITPERLLVQEKIVNVLGQAENITTEIRINLGSKMGMSLSPIGGAAQLPKK